MATTMEASHVQDASLGDDDDDARSAGDVVSVVSGDVPDVGTRLGRTFEVELANGRVAQL